MTIFKESPLSSVSMSSDVYMYVHIALHGTVDVLYLQDIISNIEQQILL